MRLIPRKQQEYFVNYPRLQERLKDAIIYHQALKSSGGRQKEDEVYRKFIEDVVKDISIALTGKKVRLVSMEKSKPIKKSCLLKDKSRGKIIRLP